MICSDKTKGNVRLEGSAADLLNDYMHISVGINAIMKKELGEDHWNAITEIIRSMTKENKEEKAKDINEIIFLSFKEQAEKKLDEKDPTTGNPLLDALLSAVFGGGDK